MTAPKVKLSGEVAPLDITVTATTPTTGFSVIVSRPPVVRPTDGSGNGGKGWDCSTVVSARSIECKYSGVETIKNTLRLNYVLDAESMPNATPRTCTSARRSPSTAGSSGSRRPPCR